MTNFNSTPLNVTTLSFAEHFPSADRTENVDGLSKAMRKNCQRLIKKAMKVAAGNAKKPDPIVGNVRPVSAVADSAVRKHGTLLPKVLAGILKEQGLQVITEMQLPIYEAALSLARSNDYDAIKHVDVDCKGEIAGHYRADLVVFDPKTKWLGIFDGKRGTGNSDSSSTAQLIPKLIALRLTALAMMKTFNIPALTCDVAVIDFYGNSGYPDDLKVNGCDLNDYFGFEVDAGLAEFNQCFAVGLANLLKMVAPSSGADPQAVKAQPLSDFGFANPDGRIIHDLFNEPDEFCDRSLALARHQLTAVQMAAAA